MKKFSMTIFWSDEDDGYFSASPEFPWVSGFGKSPEDAIAELRVAIQRFMDSYDCEELTLSKPQNGQTDRSELRVRIPDLILRPASLLAFGEGITLESFIVIAVAEKIGSKRIKPGITEVIREV